MTPISLIRMVTEEVTLEEKAGHVTSLFYGMLVLVILILIASFVIKHYRKAAHSKTDPTAVIHSMLTNLQKSYDRGEISSEEYRSIKAELITQLQDLMKNS